jgi:hypothetical protein
MDKRAVAIRIEGHEWATRKEYGTVNQAASGAMTVIVMRPAASNRTS